MARGCGLKVLFWGLNCRWQIVGGKWHGKSLEESRDGGLSGV